MDNLEAVIDVFAAADRECLAIVSQAMIDEADDRRHTAALSRCCDSIQQIISLPLRDNADVVALAEFAFGMFLEAECEGCLPPAEFVRPLLEKLARAL